MKPVHQILTDEIDAFMCLVSKAYDYKSTPHIDIKDTHEFRRQFDKSRLALTALKQDLERVSQ